MNGRNKVFLGILLIVVGVFVLLNNMNVLPDFFSIFNIGFIISKLWPILFLILPGIAFHISFFNGRDQNAGLLVPGGILIVTGIVLFLSQTFSAWHILWPGFILAVAVGLFELYLFGNKEEGLLIPVTILGSISLIFFSINLGIWLGFNITKYFIPAILIIIGIIMIFRNRPDKNEYK